MVLFGDEQAELAGNTYGKRSTVAWAEIIPIASKNQTEPRAPGIGAGPDPPPPPSATVPVHVAVGVVDVVVVWVVALLAAVELEVELLIAAGRVTTIGVETVMSCELERDYTRVRGEGRGGRERTMNVEKEVETAAAGAVGDISSELRTGNRQKMQEQHPQPSASTSTSIPAPSELTLQCVHSLLSQESDAKAACLAAEWVVEDPTIQEEILKLGLARTETAAERAREVWDERGEAGFGEWLEEEERVVLRMRGVLLERGDRLKTWREMESAGRWTVTEEAVSAPAPAPALEKQEEEEDAWGNDDDDAWADDPNFTFSTDPLANVTLTTEPSSDPSSLPPTSLTRSSAPLTLSDFLLRPLLQTACILASSGEYMPLQQLIKRHSLYPYRFTILSSIPEWEDVERHCALLPGYDWKTERESVPSSEPWRVETDFCERPAIIDLISPSPPPSTEASIPSHPAPLLAQELSAWYLSRLSLIDKHTGAVDTALQLTQFAASLGLPGMDETGEELSLLSRLVYDAPSPKGKAVDYTLEDWRSLSPAQVVDAYLAGSTPETVAREVKRLVLPYLYVLEARAERSGHPDPLLPSKLLSSYLLRSPLPLAQALFEASKPTLPEQTRIIKSDEDVARLALAYLYGSDLLLPGDWTSMSKIFECLPAWPSAGEDEAETTVASLAAFVAPSTQAKPGPEELLLFFNPLPRGALSQLLDVLDVHLESGELLAKWNSPAPLRWFLQSKEDKEAQRAWATRLTRGVARSLGAEDGEGEWRNLWEDMERLAGDLEPEIEEEEGEKDAWDENENEEREREKTNRPAFGLLGREEVAKVFFAGLLSSGNFKLAKRMLMPPREPWPLTGQVIEHLVLAASREFYDNAESGNFHEGEMSLAYECLAVAPSSPAVNKERAFIEATSRLCSYNLLSRSGNTLSPIEIRLTKDKLALIARLLSSTEDMYKHPEVILELVDKLGFAGDEVARIKALAMIATTALQSEDFAAAAGVAEGMLARVFDLRVADPQGAKDSDSGTFEALTVCWQTCFQLGGQSEYHDAPRKMHLLSNALKLCPAENITDVLAAWRKVEVEVDAIPVDETLLSFPLQNGKPASISGDRHTKAHHLLPHLSDIHLPSSLMNQETAAMAARTFNRVAANFTFPGRARTASIMSGESDRESARSGSPDLGKQARSVFTRGVGWLIGADEEQ
ncbi:hypothetical protein DACRYDRAFT_100138 [Dacryopinax primogenitus]|uniref:Sec39 domain-containing protein n=1 Tax=Dacryopinax primogenitus (strain DJM 731) TaxID=1858805 RepID=M5FZA6_DACPD|nr:uncharacterized protein DACRYDRAFT_100138 [Dacryopinax primogenitus]EJU01849.1 hypothetical protein DACRYDRAFT_100138 [Dacryopinax primogenitus]